MIEIMCIMLVMLKKISMQQEPHTLDPLLAHTDIESQMIIQNLGMQSF